MTKHCKDCGGIGHHATGPCVPCGGTGHLDIDNSDKPDIDTPPRTPTSVEAGRDEYLESRERAKKFLYKHGPSVTLDMVPTIMLLFAEKEAALHGKETEQ